MVVVQRVTIEDILAKFSLLSPYYLKLFSVIIFAAATNAFYSVNYVFAASNTNYRCKYPQCETSGLSDTLELTLQEYRCYQIPLISNNGTCSLGDVDISSKEDLEVCDEFVYEDQNSFVGENNLGCADWKRTFPGMVHSFGYMIGLLMMGPLADKIGRKKLIILTGTIAALMGLGKSLSQAYWVYIVLELVEALFGDTYSCTFMLGNIILSISLFLVGRFMATISLAIVYLYTSELFPTHTRNTMHALCSSLGRTATLVSSQTPLMMRHLYGLPSILVGGLSLMTGIIVITLPDTADDVLPDTVRQAEAAGAAE